MQGFGNALGERAGRLVLAVFLFGMAIGIFATMLAPYLPSIRLVWE